MAQDKKKPDKKILNWEPTQKLKPPDGIKSSDYTNSKPFIPSYEKEPRPKMAYIMSNEYARIWQREREEFDKPVVQDTKYLPKKFVIRGLNKKKQNLKNNNKENVGVRKEKNKNQKS